MASMIKPFFIFILSLSLVFSGNTEKKIQGVERKRILDPFNAYFQNLKSFQSSIIQTNHNGQIEKAVLLIKDNRMRLAYAAYEIRASNGKLYHYDSKTKQKEELIREQTPLFFLFSKKRIEDVAYVDHIHFIADQVEVTLRNKNDPESGSLTLIFKKKPLNLIAWRLKDAQNRVTYVALKNVQYNTNPPKDTLFMP